MCSVFRKYFFEDGGLFCVKSGDADLNSEEDGGYFEIGEREYFLFLFGL